MPLTCCASSPVARIAYLSASPLSSPRHWPLFSPLSPRPHTFSVPPPPPSPSTFPPSSPAPHTLTVKLARASSSHMCFLFSLQGSLTRSYPLPYRRTQKPIACLKNPDCVPLRPMCSLRQHRSASMSFHIHIQWYALRCPESLLPPKACLHPFVSDSFR